MKLWSKSDIALYLESILGHAPTPARDGQFMVPGPNPSCRQRGHEADIDVNSGQWRCPGCCNGPLEEYEMRRVGLNSTSFSPERQAVENIRQIVLQEADRRRERAQQAQALARKLALPPDAARLLRKVYGSRGQCFRYFQQVSHLRPRKLRAAIRQLERNGLITHTDIPSTGGRKRRLFFPAMMARYTDVPEAVR